MKKQVKAISLGWNVYELPEQQEIQKSNGSPSRKNLFYALGGFVGLTVIISGGILILSTNGKRKVEISDCLITGKALHGNGIEYTCECYDALGGTYQSTFVSEDLLLNLGSRISVNDHQLYPRLYTIPRFRNNGPIHEQLVPITD